MIEYRVIRKDYKVLKQLGIDNWQLICIDEDKMIFSKNIRGSVEKETKNALKSEKWLEFRELYKTIKDSGLSDDKLIIKYNKLIDEGKHTLIMDNLKDYKIHLQTHKKKDYALMASTYINQKRYKDKWDIISTNIVNKWIDDLLREKNLSADIIDNIMGEIKKREAKNNKEVTNGVVNNIIDYILGK